MTQTMNMERKVYLTGLCLKRWIHTSQGKLIPTISFFYTSFCLRFSPHSHFVFKCNFSTVVLNYSSSVLCELILKKNEDFTWTTRTLVNVNTVSERMASVVAGSKLLSSLMISKMDQSKMDWSRNYRNLDSRMKAVEGISARFNMLLFFNLLGDKPQKRRSLLFHRTQYKI